MPLSRHLLFAGICSLCLANAAAEPLLDFDASTPEGSWQLREIATTDDKGRKTVSIVRQSFVGREERRGEPYYWLEMEMTNYEVNDGEREQKGDTNVLKTLVRRSAIYSDPANAINNLAGFAEEIIIQHGKSEPLRVSQGAAFAQTMMQALGVKTNYDFTETGTETVTVPAGTFEARKYEGRGETESKIMFKTLRVESRSTTWISDEVPFGIVRAVADDLINGKPQHSETRLLDFGRSGAESRITGEPVEMPSLPFGD